MLTTDVENYPGFADGILGPELMDQMEKQAARFGAEILSVHVTRVDFSSRPFGVWAGDQEWRARTVVIATGATARWLDVPGEEKLRGRGRLRVRDVRRLLLPRPRARRGRRRRLGDGGGDVPHEVRVQGHDRPPARRVPRIEDHAGAGPREPQDRGDLERGGGGGPRRGRRDGRPSARHRHRRDPGVPHGRRLRRDRPHAEHRALPRLVGARRRRVHRGRESRARTRPSRACSRRAMSPIGSIVRR